MRTYAVGTALAVALLGAWAAFASPTHGGHAHAGVNKRAAVICPVTEKTVADPASAPKSIYRGKTYYFCSSGCKTKFDKNPAQYVTPASAKAGSGFVCPVMGTHVDDVAKAAGKSVYKGKTYYFCCPQCKPKFDKNPAKYVKAAVPKAHDHHMM